MRIGVMKDSKTKTEESTRLTYTGLCHSHVSLSWIPLSRCLFPRLLPGFFSEVKFYSRKRSLSGFPGEGTIHMGIQEALVPDQNFNRPVKDLVYKDLLPSTFIQTSHDRCIKTWRVSVSYPQCVFCGNKFRYEAFNCPHRNRCPSEWPVTK
jgi:hypothetical protein